MAFIISDVVIRGLGIFLNMFGVALIWVFGLPPRMDVATRAYVAGVEHDSDKMRKQWLLDLGSNVGIVLLLGGFFLQFIANYIEGAMLFDLSFKPNY
jgi:hypothetical protein